MNALSVTAACCLLVLGASPALAGPDAFTTGPVIEGWGPAADVPGAPPLPADTVMRVSFDTSTAAAPGSVNRTLESAARFLNMHARAGIPVEDIHLAVIIHGGAVRDVTNADSYAAVNDAANASAGLVAALLAQGVEIQVCGQSAVYYDVGVDDLLPGVTMALSAMTAHALLQQDGYTLNPF